MGFLDRFLGVIKINDDDQEEEEYFDEDDTVDLDEERTTPGRRLIRRGEDEEEEEYAQTVPASDPYLSRTVRKKRSSRGNGRARSTTSYSSSVQNSSKVSNFPMRANVDDISEEEEQTNNFAVCVIRPKTMEDALEIARTLVSNCTVILNLEGLELDVSQRIFDFASGACCAVQGNLDKISNYIFVLTPEGVRITGEFQKILIGAFDPDVDLGLDRDDY